MPTYPTYPVDRIAELLAAGHSYNSTADHLDISKHGVVVTVRRWRADPATVPSGYPNLLADIAARYRDTSKARTDKESGKKQRARAAAARRRARLLTRIATTHDVPMDVAEEMLAAAEAAPELHDVVRVLTPPLKPAQAARRLPNGMHPRSARAVRLRHTAAPRRAYA